MVQPQSIERPDITVAPLMNADEARACVARINGHINSARAELLRLYEGSGWAALGYASWRECVAAEFEDSRATLYRQLEAAQIESRILTSEKIGTLPAKTIRPLAQLTPMEQPLAWQEATERSGGKPTARVVEQVVKEMLAADENDELDPPMELEQVADQFPDELTSTDKRLLQGSISAPRMNAGLYSSATPEWYTPAHIIERVIRVLGAIDLDPCSNSDDPLRANVPASKYWTQETDGLAQPWHGRVYMNPPYGDEVGAWVDRLLSAYQSGEIDRALALLPGRTDTTWFRPLLQHPICFIWGRLRFSGSANSAPFPSVVVAIGCDLRSFRDAFEDSVGTVKI